MREDKKLIIDHILFYEGIYDFLHLESKVKKLLVNVHLSKVMYKINKINFLNIELLTSHEMQYVNNNTYTTDILTLVYPREVKGEVDVIIYLDPMLIFFFVKLGIEFENSYLPQTLENRIIELINHGIFHAIGFDHEKHGINPTMLDYERLNLINYLN